MGNVKTRIASALHNVLCAPAEKAENMLSLLLKRTEVVFQSEFEFFFRA